MRNHPITTLLKIADIEPDGKDPWDIQIHNPQLYDRVLREGSLGLGESYMDGWWDAERLDEFFTRVLGADLDRKIKKNIPLLMRAVVAQIFNLQSRNRAFAIGEKHYDIGNDLYTAMLDRRMTYTCGYWNMPPLGGGVHRRAVSMTLDDAQEAKLDLVCKKISLKAGDRVLDIGCGWGSFAKFAAEKYGARVVGITVSKEQLKLGTELCTGLPIELRLQDYRDVNEQFDHIVSLGMFEHVGYKNYRDYMEVAHRCLKDDGLFLLHTIGGNRSVTHSDAWITKYIFTNSMLPSIAQIGRAIEGLFVMEDWHNFSADYDKTLMSWFANFDRAWHGERIRLESEAKPFPAPTNSQGMRAPQGLASKYGEQFYRMWKYYLMASAGTFRARKNQLWQIVLSKNGVPGGYTSIR